MNLNELSILEIATGFLGFIGIFILYIVFAIFNILIFNIILNISKRYTNKYENINDLKQFVYGGIINIICWSIVIFIYVLCYKLVYYVELCL